MKTSYPYTQADNEQEIDDECPNGHRPLVMQSFDGQVFAYCTNRLCSYYEDPIEDYGAPDWDAYAKDAKWDE